MTGGRSSGTPRLAQKQQSVELRDELAVDEQLAEGRVTFVIRRLGQYHLATGRDQSTASPDRRR